MNCSMAEDTQVHLDLHTFGSIRTEGWRELYTDDPFAVNTFAEEKKVVPVEKKIQEPNDGVLDILIRKHSWNVLQFVCKN